MIRPFPDKAAHQAIGRAEHFPVVFEISRAVAHRMAVFAVHHRAGFPLVFQVFVFHPGRRGIHAGYEIDRIVVVLVFRIGEIMLFIVNETRIVDRFYGFRRFHEIFAVIRFVAQRPYDYGRAVFIAPHHRNGAGYDRVFV